DFSFIILGAGRGTRFDPSGHQSKLLARLPNGQPVLRAVAQSCVGLGSEALVVTGPDTSDVSAALSGLNLRVMPCITAGAGMGASLKCGLLGTCPSLGW